MKDLLFQAFVTVASGHFIILLHQFWQFFGMLRDVNLLVGLHTILYSCVMLYYPLVEL